MNAEGHADDADGFAARVQRAWSADAYQRLRSELRARPDRGLALLLALAEDTSEVVRVWAGGVAREDLGWDGMPVLMKLVRHRRAFTRDAAMQDLQALDPELLRPFIPDMRRTFLRSKPPAALYGPGGAAMWRLAALGDRESARLFRAFAAEQDPRYYDYRMPMVLADYLDDPESLLRRIEAHDHEWMQWLAMAVVSLGIDRADVVLDAAAKALPDEECRAICAKEGSRLTRPHEETRPPLDSTDDA